ncbi:MAG: class I adenylate-forming enzyme family protein [Betaproteobacteria bacterium]|nr:class I adenylate-forming enzyme family protein [Rhodocyclales bacterium]
MNLVMLLEMAAETYPDRVAVKSGGESLTYAELQRASWAAAAKITASGCGYLGLIDISSVAVPVAIFAAAYAGVPYVPINYRLTAQEMEALLERIAPALLIIGAEYAKPLTLPAAVQPVLTADFLAACRAAPAAVMTADGEPGDVAIQLFTSGTTGKPKAALLRHENLMSYILGTVEFGSAAEEDAILVTVPPYHIAGISAVLSSTYACRRMVQMPNFEAREWLRLCREENVSNVFLVPTMLARVVEEVESGAAAALPALRAIAYGGGKMPLPVIEKALRLWPQADFTNAYGLTETSSTIALLGPDEHRAAAGSSDPAVRRRLGSVGRPLPAIEMEIRDDDGNVLGADQSGLIFVRGGQVAGEYHGSGSQLDAEGWFPTRDRGSLDAEGFLFLEGRDDDVIVRGGENISPGEIEDVLLEHPAVADVAVVAIADAQWGEAVAAAIVLKDKAGVTVSELQDWVKTRLRSSRVPAAINFQAELPYNETGKLLRRVVRQEFGK